MRAIALSSLLLILGGALTGCASTTCDGLCGWFDSCRVEGSDSWEECGAVCDQDYSQAANYCRNSLYDLATCVEGSGCSAAFEDCEFERLCAQDDCGCQMLETTETCVAINAVVPPPDA